MLEFLRLVEVLEGHWSGEFSAAEVLEKLTQVFEATDGTGEAEAVALLSTARLGARHATRVPWMDVSAKDLEARLDELRVGRRAERGGEVGLFEVYEVLHGMDPVRPDWYPDRPEMRQRLVDLTGRMSSRELGCLIRLMLGMEPLADSLVLTCAARAAGETSPERLVRRVLGRLSKTTSDVGLAAGLLVHGDIGYDLLALSKVRYGAPLPLEQMHSGSPEQIARVLETLQTKTVFVQGKSDGVYMQVQKDGEQVYLFDEAGVDYGQLRSARSQKAGPRMSLRDTERERMLARVGALTEAVRGIAATRVILDAEIVGINDGGDGVASRWDTFRCKELQIIVFDLVASDEDLRRVPYRERRRMLEALIGSGPPGFEVGIYAAEEALVTGVNQVTRMFERLTAANRYEGVILKSPPSHLTKGYRWSRKRWKIKNYTTLDMLLVGAYVQPGRQQPTKFLGALRDEETRRFVPCVMAVAGSAVMKQLVDYCKATKRGICPTHVIDEGSPDLWTSADLVVEVESDGLIVRNHDRRFRSARWTLHQPHQRMIVGIRTDKTPERVNTVERLLAMKRAPGHHVKQ